MTKTPTGEPLEPVFDWYQATTQTGVKELRDVFGSISESYPLEHDTPKLKGYGWALKAGGPGGSLLVHYGGTNGDQFGPNVCATSSLAPTIANLLRSNQVQHAVSRVDVRLDFLGDFDACRLLFIERCNDAGMQATDYGACPESIKQTGRTVYGGAKSSVYRPTLYQKGLQLGDGHPTDYVRLEHRVMPSKAAEKRQLASLTPTEIVGLRPVARDLTQSLAGLAVRAYKLDRAPKARTPYDWMLSQYRKALMEQLEDLGSPEAVGKQIFWDLAQLEKEHADA